ncbi:HNH endonuclease signature motif containing protein [Nitrobacter hamburgensis]|uniref:HNH endonuclease n=1 Tax=Nitrobacter hamburgensis TaxID=912 RepID=UPI0009D78A29
MRERLLEVYNAECAITGTRVVATLQAAHIFPYRGVETNSVRNGILLRADIHNLFDLGLIQIEAGSFKILLSPDRLQSPYAKWHEQTLRLPSRKHQRPSGAALEERFRYFSEKEK